MNARGLSTPFGCVCNVLSRFPRVVFIQASNHNTTMDVEMLIANVFRRSPLWDKRDKRHANRNTTDKLWREIANEMEIDGKFDKENVIKI